MQASSASMFEWMSLRTKKRIVYDSFDATSQDRKLLAIVGVGYLNRRWVVRVEFPKPYSVAGLDDDITLHGCPGFCRLRPQRGASQRTQRFLVRNFPRMVARHP